MRSKFILCVSVLAIAVAAQAQKVEFTQRKLGGKTLLCTTNYSNQSRQFVYADIKIEIHRIRSNKWFFGTKNGTASKASKFEEMGKVNLTTKDNLPLIQLFDKNGKLDFELKVLTSYLPCKYMASNIDNSNLTATSPESNSLSINLIFGFEISSIIDTP